MKNTRELPEDTIAIQVNGIIQDLNLPIPDDAHTEIITRNNPKALPLIRHDCAHVMAEAVQTLYPETQVTIGPPIEDGFYYDFAREIPFTPEDLVNIEAKMHEIIAQNHPFTREVWSRQQAINYFTQQKEYYKVEIIKDLPENEVISIYRQGTWLDLCRGPHMCSTGQIGQAFKLLRVSGAYWRGDSRNPMLQRIYGTAWQDENALHTYLHRIEEAKRRDHRLLGRHMDLFHFQDYASGSVFWHPKGWTLWCLLENYIRDRLKQEGYIEVKTPQLVDRSLWERSGHWEKFRQHMYTVHTDEEKIFALKPMNCPCHVEIFRQGIKSYRDLPLRMAEFGSCHRQEPSGSLHGLMRLRAFTQDDAHIFCTEEQILSESVAFCRLLEKVYADFGFTQITVKFSDRPLVRAGSDEVWDRAEHALRLAVEQAGLHYTHNPGEGAFYGPKLEFILSDTLNRHWQCGTLQVDFILPERLDASYMDNQSHKQRPVMLHRAILGSLERFIGILIEHYAGWLPFWLSPVQGVITTITNDVDTYAHHLSTLFQEKGLRVLLDCRNEKLPLKIREHTQQKIPLILIIGRKEQQNQTVTLRWHNKPQQNLPIEQALQYLTSSITRENH